ncbi:MAG: hypothetical protein M3Q81_00040 [bacterium]|nr:hypothetical protein [bacterium]
MMKFVFQLWLVGCLLIWLWGSNISSVKAQSSAEGILKLEPAFQEVVLEEGQLSSNASFTFTNTTRLTQVLDIFPLDLEQHNEMGEIILKDKIDTSFTLAPYLKLSQERISIAPGASVTVEASLVNSTELSPGGHYAAVVGRFVRQDIPQFQQVLPGISSIVLLHKKGGEQFILSLIDTGVPKVAITFKQPSNLRLLFENNGNVHIIPYGRVEFKDIFKRVVYKGIVNEGSLYVLPKTERQITTTLKNIRYDFPVMLYQVSIQGAGDRGETAFASSIYYFYISPWLILLVLGGIGLLYFWKRKVKNTKE